MSVKKQKTDETVIWPTIKGVDKPLLQTLATVCHKLYDEALFAAWKPVDGEPDNTLEQTYELSKAGGQYKPGGKYKPLEGGKYEYLNGTRDVLKGIDVFNNSTIQPVDGKPYGTASLASYGEVIDGFTDFHRESQALFPPFAALIVKPKDEPVEAAPILILAWRGSTTVWDWINDFACSPSLSSRWSDETKPETKEIRAHGMILNLVENTFSLHEREIVDLIDTHKVERAFFTGHSLAGGLANVAHLVVRGQLALSQAGLLGSGSPWTNPKLNKVDWLACTFASLQPIVRKYVDKIPSLIADLDASSYNVVYGCDPVSRAPGMLKFLGDCVEVVAPKIVKETVGLPAWAGIGLFLDGKFSSFHGVDTATSDVVKFLKNKGVTEVIGQFTHVGTVVYLAAEGLNPPKEGAGYVYLTGKDDIQKVLNVKEGEFLKLWGGVKGEGKYAEAAAKAHNAAYLRFVYK